MHFADASGIEQLVDRMHTLTQQVGSRFEPADILRRLAETAHDLSHWREAVASAPTFSSPVCYAPFAR